MGGIIRKGDGWVETEMSKLEGITVDLSQSPDLLPITSVLASFAKGKTEIKGVEHARVKESDRISSMAFNLREAGINVVEKRDGLIIEGGMPRGGSIQGHLEITELRWRWWCWVLQLKAYQEWRGADMSTHIPGSSRIFPLWELM
jgi:5-enolpyruvylshikimate-3-phosphate synthase